ncbi:MAG: hypothetical protein M3445_11405 [Actinomycetota bacterium]|nr:hypothetical protein [Actinomycetota bacterium]
MELLADGPIGAKRAEDLLHRVERQHLAGTDVGLVAEPDRLRLDVGPAARRSGAQAGRRCARALVLLFRLSRRNDEDHAHDEEDAGWDTNAPGVGYPEPPR